MSPFIGQIPIKLENDVYDTFRERRPVYRAYSRGCGLINDLFDSSLSSTLRARMPRIERTIEFYVNTLVQERKPGSSA